MQVMDVANTFPDNLRLEAALTVNSGFQVFYPTAEARADFVGQLISRQVAGSLPHADAQLLQMCFKRLAKADGILSIIPTSVARCGRSRYPCRVFYMCHSSEVQRENS